MNTKSALINFMMNGRFGGIVHTQAEQLTGKNTS